MNNVFVGRATLQAIYFESYRQDKINEVELSLLTASLWGDYLAQGLLGRAMQTPYAASVYVPVLLGYGASYWIAGEEGLDDFSEFLLEPEMMIPRTVESLEEVIPHLVENYESPFKMPVPDLPSIPPLPILGSELLQHGARGWRKLHQYTL